MNQPETKVNTSEKLQNNEREFSPKTFSRGAHLGFTRAQYTQCFRVYHHDLFASGINVNL